MGICYSNTTNTDLETTESDGMNKGNPFSVGDKVYRNFPFDGTPKQGYPDKSQVFTIVKIDDHVPVDGPPNSRSVCHLKPGVAWSFWYYLTRAE